MPAPRAINGSLGKTGRTRIGSGSRVNGHSTPASVGGWNARDSVANMAESDAILLDNWFPEETSIRLRKGYASHATGLGSAVLSLMSWNGPSSTKMFGAIATAVYEVTSSGAVGSAEFSSMNSGYWQHTNFANSSGHYLYICNGSDAPRYYNGSSWTTPTITGSGLTATNLIHVNAHNKRLWFIEKNTMNAWYFPTETISGAITKFDLGAQATLGGSLIAMGTWTRDGGDGSDDLAVWVTSEGQVIVYAGTDPSSADTWTLVGVYRIGAPLGRRCMVRLGGDLVIMTEDGFSQLSRFIVGGRASTKAALSDKISQAIISAVGDFRSSNGWQPVHFPAGNMILFNIPETNTKQFVANATTGAWCRYRDIAANCWEVHNDKLYFGASGIVYEAETGTSDANTAIVGYCIPSFSYFGSRAREKLVTMVRPNFEADATGQAAYRINTDFQTQFPTGDLQDIGVSGGSMWDVGEWDVAFWGGGYSAWARWKTTNGKGRAATLAIKASTNAAANIRLNSIDWLYQPVASAGFI